MSRRPALHTQADLNRALKAAEQATGEKHEIVLELDGRVRIVRAASSMPNPGIEPPPTAAEPAPLAKVRKFVL